MHSNRGWAGILTTPAKLHFRHLPKVVDLTVPFSINDFGCGYGAVVEYLKKEADSFLYCGFDISPEMIRKEKERYGTTDGVSFFGLESELSPADSGIFNGTFETPVPEWEAYSDQELRRADLCYADPAFPVGYRKTKFRNW